MADRRSRYPPPQAEGVARTGRKGSSSSQTSSPSAPPATSQSPLSTLPPSSRVLSKIAIPRLRRESEPDSAFPSSKSGDKHRVSHACEPCRHRKTKCSGERPVCKHCEDHGIACVYADGKRDRAKKEMGNMMGKVDEYEALLRQVSSQVDGATQLAIQKALTKSPSPAEPSLESTPSRSRMDSSLDQDSDDNYQDGETIISAGVGSTGSLDKTHEDFDKDENTRATGFIGKNSEVAWIQRVDHQLKAGSSSAGTTSGTGTRDSGAHGSGGKDSTKSDELRLSQCTYHLDDLDISVAQTVDENALPPKEIADLLLNAYFTTVHVSFPFLLKNVFLGQYQTYYRTYDRRFSRRWLAILNLVFAISAKFSHLIRADWRGDERDHLIFFARARLQGLDHGSFWEHADFEQVQAFGLLTFYLMATDQINKAWILSGNTIRLAQSLGLHLMNKSTDTTPVQKEVSVRVWWSIYSLERLLGVMTGRPSAVSDADISTPLPLPIEEEYFPIHGGPFMESPKAGDASGKRSHSGDTRPPAEGLRTSKSSSVHSSSSHEPRSKASSRSMSPAAGTLFTFPPLPTTPPNMSTYFICRTQLAMLTHQVLSTLFCARTVQRSWAEVQDIIGDLNYRLLKWRSNLPSLFDFNKNQRDQVFVRQRMALGMMFYGSQMLINRPCLCRVDKKVPNESAKSFNFNHTSATTCVQAARRMIALIPDEPNPTGLFSIAPWWCLLHHLMQAGSIFMLEMSFRAEHTPGQAAETLADAKKVVQWLRSMSEDNLAARRAWQSMLVLLRRAARRIGGDTSDVPQHPPQVVPQPSRIITQSEQSIVNAFQNSMPMDQDVFQQMGSMYPHPHDSDNSFEPYLYTSYDDFQQDGLDLAHFSVGNTVGNPGNTHVSALFPSASQMFEFKDHEMGGYQYQQPGLSDGTGPSQSGGMPDGSAHHHHHHHQSRR